MSESASYLGTEKLYEGKAKIIYKGPEEGTVVQYFKDDATAFNNQKHAVINSKGQLNNLISENLMLYLGEKNIPNHFIKRLNDREQLIKTVEIIPLEVIIRNVTAGTLCKKLNLEEGKQLSRPLIEFSYKNDALGDPLIGEGHILALEFCSEQELETIKRLALQVNDALKTRFVEAGIQLVDFKLEFGRLNDKKSGEVRVVLADEVSPDTCRLWDIKTKEKMDKDRFRRDLGNVIEAYQEVARRLGIEISSVV